MDRIPVKRVLVSVSDKTGLAEFAGALSAVLLLATLLLVIVFRRALALNKGFKLG